MDCRPCISGYVPVDCPPAVYIIDGQGPHVPYGCPRGPGSCITREECLLKDIKRFEIIRQGLFFVPEVHEPLALFSLHYTPNDFVLDRSPDLDPNRDTVKKGQRLWEYRVL